MEKLPDNLTQLISKQLPNQEVLLALSTDLTSGGKFGEEWLVVTADTLLTISGLNKDYKPIFELPIRKITRVAALNMVGGGLLEVETDKDIYRPLLYSNARASEFALVAKNIESLIKDGRIKKESTEKKIKYCSHCGRPIPEDLGSCPHCVKKRKVFLRLIRFTEKYFRHLFLIFIFMILVTLFGLATPWISKIFIDDILKPLKNAWLLGPLSLALLLAYAGQMFFGALQARVSALVGYKAVYDIRGMLYRKLQELSLSYYDKRQTGVIMARVTQDTNELRRFLVDWLPIIMETWLTLLGVGILLFALNWRLTLLVIIPIFGAIWFIKWSFPKLGIFFHRFFESRSRLNALVSDTLSGIRVVKVFGQEKVELKKFNQKSSDFRNTGILLEQKWATYFPFLNFLIMSGTVVVWYVGGRFVFAGAMTLGTIVAYAGYLMMFYRPIFVLAQFTRMIGSSLSAADRIFAVIDIKPEIQDAPDAVHIEIKGKIEFRNVSFGYAKFKSTIKNIKIVIQPTEMIGLVGRSGTGKSTIINLICRLYDVDEGKILIDGIDIKKIRYADLRRQIGVVLQDTFLFNGTIAENISYAKPEATRLEIIKASKTANAHKFIMAKPYGYDSEVGENGKHLSGGEKQRIAIARAILRDPRILILDEATSSVDTETEKEIQEALARLVKGRTTIAIAHRLSTLRNSNRLLVLEDGKQIELGTHDELLEKKGTFYRLVHMQKELSQIKEIDG